MTVAYGALPVFGAIPGWNYTNSTSSVDASISEAQDAIGNVTASQTNSEILPVTASLDCDNDTNTVPASIGDIVNSIDLTSITINTVNKGSCAKMTLSGHNHTAAPHTALKKVAHGIALTQCFGCEDMVGGTAGVNADVKSVSINISCGHSDEADKDGFDHFCGENVGPAKITITQVWTGVPTTPFNATTWTGTATTTTNPNTGDQTTTVNVTKYLILA